MPIYDANGDRLTNLRDNAGNLLARGWDVSRGSYELVYQRGVAAYIVGFLDGETDQKIYRVLATPTTITATAVADNIANTHAGYRAAVGVSETEFILIGGSSNPILCTVSGDSVTVANLTTSGNADKHLDTAFRLDGRMFLMGNPVTQPTPIELFLNATKTNVNGVDRAQSTSPVSVAARAGGGGSATVSGKVYTMDEDRVAEVYLASTNVMAWRNAKNWLDRPSQFNIEAAFGIGDRMVVMAANIVGQGRGKMFSAVEEVSGWRLTELSEVPDLDRVWGAVNLGDGS